MMEASEFKRFVAFLRRLLRGTEFAGKTFCVGGCVRDSLLGRVVSDVDLAVASPGGAFELAMFADARGGRGFYSAQVIYPNSGAVLFQSDDFPGVKIETVGMEPLGSGSPFERGQTVFETLANDASERDFTIDALYLDVSSGEVLDPTGLGKRDLESSLIRCAGNPDETLMKDPLRILRGIRLGCELFEAPVCESGTAAAMRRASAALAGVASERIRDEVLKTFSTLRAGLGVSILWDVFLRGGFADLYGIGTDVKAARMASDAACAVSAFPEPDAVSACCAVLECFKVCESAAEVAVGIMKMSKVFTREVFLRRRLLAGYAAAGGGTPKQKRHFLHACGTPERLRAVETLAGALGVSGADAAKSALDALAESDGKNGADPFRLPLPLSGWDVVERLGVQQGLAVGRALNLAREMCEDDPLVSKETVLERLESRRKEWQ